MSDTGLIKTLPKPKLLCFNLFELEPETHFAFEDFVSKIVMERIEQVRIQTNFRTCV